MEALVGFAVGAIVLYVWGWRRWRYLQAHWQRRERSEALETALRNARASAADPSPWRLRGDGDRAAFDMLTSVSAKADEQALEQLGFRTLGEIALERSDKAVALASRAFVSADGTTIATLSVSAKARGHVMALFSSHCGERQIATSRGAVPSLAKPPFVEYEALPVKTSLAAVFEAHVGRPRPDAAAITTIDQLLARANELRERTLAWRAAEPPDELLDADLRAMLGPAYASSGKMWFAKLRGKLPEARIAR